MGLFDIFKRDDDRQRVRQQERTERVQARQEGRSDRTRYTGGRASDPFVEGGYGMLSESLAGLSLQIPGFGSYEGDGRGSYDGGGSYEEYEDQGPEMPAQTWGEWAALNPGTALIGGGILAFAAGKLTGVIK